MITSFSIENFRSFKSRSVLLSGQGGRAGCSPVIALFGPNASGKSNVFKALSYFRQAVANQDVINSATVSHPILQPFLLSAKVSTKIAFEIGLHDEPKKTDYRYGFAIDAEQKIVAQEWLFESKMRRKHVSERRIFTRNLQQFSFGAGVGGLKRSTSKVHPTVLALRRFANENNSEALAVSELLLEQLVLFDSLTSDGLHQVAFKRFSEDPKLKLDALEIAKQLDFALTGFEIDTQPIPREILDRAPLSDEVKSRLAGNPEGFMGTVVATTHNVYDAKGSVVSQRNLDFGDNESAGTQKFLPFLAMVIDAMKVGLTIVVDEFGSGLHPFISARLVEIFSNPPHKGQFILLTHETYLLNNKVGLNRDQIWLVSKNRQEQSQLQSLDSFKPRDDARLDKQYLEGRFGAVPVLLK